MVSQYTFLAQILTNLNKTSRFLKFNLLFVNIFSILALSDAHAKEVPETLDAIQVTATRREELAQDIPVAVTIKTRAQLDKTPAQTVADLLHGEIGTFVQQTTPGQGVVIVRGLKGSEVLHLVDGFRLNNAFFRNAPNQYPALVDALAVEQVEVVRGPSSVLYGSDAMGGVVHMITREPKFEGSDWQTTGIWKSRYGSADSSTQNRLSLQTGREGLAMQFGSSYQDTQNLRVGGGDELPFTEFSARYSDFALSWQPHPEHGLQVKMQYARQPKTPRFDELVPGFGQTRPTSSEFLFKPQERYFGLLRYQNGAATLLYDGFDLTIGRQDIVDGRLNRDFGTLNRDTERSRSELGGVLMQFDKTHGDALWTYGFERFADEIASTRVRTNINSGATSVRAPRFPNGSTMGSKGAFIALDYYGIERLDIQAGLRHSRFSVKLPPVPGVGIGIDIAPKQTTGNLGLRYELTEHVNFVANIGRGFRAPNVFDLGAFGSRPGNRFNEPNGALEPEIIDSIDTGLKWSSERWQGEAYVFKSRYQDKITSLENGDRTPAGQIIVRNVNATQLDLYGIELMSRYQFNDKTQGYLSATLTRGTEKLALTEDNADRIPPLFGKLGLSYQISDAISVDGYSLYATRQDRLSARDLSDPRINPAGTAGWVSLNFRADWRLNDAIKLGFSAENIADKRYREHGTGLDEPGRNFGVSLDWGF